MSIFASFQVVVVRINAAIKGITATHECAEAQLAVDKVNDYFGAKSLSDLAAGKVRLH